MRRAASLLATAILLPADCLDDLASARPAAAQRCPSITGRVRQGHSLYLIARDTEAVNTLEAVLQESPNHEDVLYVLGRVHYLNGHYEPCRQRFAAIVAHNPHRAWNNLGLALEAVVQMDAAVRLTYAPSTW